MAARLASGGRYYGGGQTGKPGAVLKTKQSQDAADGTCRRLPPIDRNESLKIGRSGRRASPSGGELGAVTHKIGNGLFFVRRLLLVPASRAIARGAGRIVVSASNAEASASNWPTGGAIRYGEGGPGVRCKEER